MSQSSKRNGDDKAKPKSQPKKAREPAKPRRPWFLALGRWGAVAAVWLLLAVGAIVLWYGTDLPDVEAAVAATRRPSVTVVASDGAELATTGDLYGVPVQVKDLPPALPAAVLSIEDRSNSAPTKRGCSTTR